MTLFERPRCTADLLKVVGLFLHPRHDPCCYVRDPIVLHVTLVQRRKTLIVVDVQAPVVECVWSDGGVGVVWGPWSACSVACGVGVETRRRVVCNPAHRRLCQNVRIMQKRPCIRHACKPGTFA